MLFIAIAQHTPDQCPGHNKELFDELQSTMPRLPDIAQKHGVKILGFYSMMPSHKTVALCDAPSFEAASMVLFDSGLTGWNTIEIAQAYTSEEAMKLSAQHFAQQ
jgi:hypothetical protein